MNRHFSQGNVETTEMRVDTRGSSAKSHLDFFGQFVFWRRFNMWQNVVEFATMKAFQSFNSITKSHLLFPCTFSHFKINSQRITLPACLRACCDFSLSKFHRRTMTTRKYTPSPSWIERKNLIYKIELAVGSSANVGEKKWKLLESSKIQSSMSCGISARRLQLTSSPQFIEISSLVRCLPSLSTLFFSFNTQWVFG